MLKYSNIGLTVSITNDNVKKRDMMDESDACHCLGGFAQCEGFDLHPFMTFHTPSMLGIAKSVPNSLNLEVTRGHTALMRVFAEYRK